MICFSDKKQTVTKKKRIPEIVSVDWTEEILRYASSEDNEGFQRPQSLISCPRYQRFILRRRGGQLTWSQRPRASILALGHHRVSQPQHHRVLGLTGPFSDKEASQSSSQVSAIRASLMVMI